MRAELAQFDHQRKGTLDQVQFKRAMKQLAVAMTDVEIKDLYDMTVRINKTAQLEITVFVKMVTDASKSKPLPSYMNSTTVPGRKV